ncbi:acyl-CoA thioesterase [Zongyangia hominis]|uniref:Acyl-CoA thioesterase n=1 Tax=Zongyangia hominis TaxID=2763677 RepID=A0A926EEC3_9FIRM|nr:thioesterase family protein [Zongyangia hominis]MBC8570624.1 acyl-CoA thioesterase [Zongyangia hominis]
MISESRITVRYAETDQMGVTHHAVYPIWYEVARTDFIKQLGITYSEMERMGVMTPLIELTCHYHGVTRYEDELVVRVTIGRLTPARIQFCYEIYHVGEERPCNTGSTTHAWVDAATFRPINMKRKFPDLYEKMAHPPVGDTAL